MSLGQSPQVLQSGASRKRSNWPLMTTPIPKEEEASQYSRKELSGTGCVQSCIPTRGFASTDAHHSRQSSCERDKIHTVLEV
ncbi:hypothetical protein M408DRAFT_263891 [Serendipita vermifera MAFF 305830]|uniref:Uncharacterized protein n=1 Tax=Serendipita vermifera MAFF 305830 TaxID=933852 RepID=A0A0C3ATN1_SERVB|nr:hypothetical protein M408DRAFT_263891 [Serendipita vermifera MAFF 305830]